MFLVLPLIPGNIMVFVNFKLFVDLHETLGSCDLLLKQRQGGTFPSANRVKRLEGISSITEAQTQLQIVNYILNTTLGQSSSPEKPYQMNNVLKITLSGNKLSWIRERAYYVFHRLVNLSMYQKKRNKL